MTVDRSVWPDQRDLNSTISEPTHTQKESAMTKTQITTADEATDANTLDATILMSEAKLTSMTPRALHPYEADALREALNIIEWYGKFTPTGIQYRCVYSIDDLLAFYRASLPPTVRVPRTTDMERNMRKTLIDQSSEEFTYIARVPVDIDPDLAADWGVGTDPITGEKVALPQLVWHSTVEGGLADLRGETAWCVLYMPNLYLPEPNAKYPNPVHRAGTYNHRGWGQVVKVYTANSPTDPEDDANEFRSACSTVRRISTAVCDAPNDMVDDDAEPVRRTPKFPMA